MLRTKISQDIYNGLGLCVIDVHGDLIQKIAKTIPGHRKKDIIYLDATDPHLEWGYNPLRKVSIEKRPLIVSSILEIFNTYGGNKVGELSYPIF